MGVGQGNRQELGNAPYPQIPPIPFKPRVAALCRSSKLFINTHRPFDTSNGHDVDFSVKAKVETGRSDVTVTHLHSLWGQQG